MVQSSLSIRELSPEAQRPDLYLKRLLCVAVLANPPRRNEAFVIPHRVGREILDRDTQFCMPGLVWITQRVHKRCEGHWVTLLCRQKLLSGLAEADMSKTSSCQPWQAETAAVCGGALQDPLNSSLHTPPSALMRCLFLFLRCFPYPPHGDLRGPLLEWKFSNFFHLFGLSCLHSKRLCLNPFLLSKIQSFLLSKNQQPDQAPHGHASLSSYTVGAPDSPSEQKLSRRVGLFGLLRKRRRLKLFPFDNLCKFLSAF